MLFATDFDNIGGMPAACTFGMKSVNGAPFQCCYSGFNKARFIECVSMDHNLHIHVISHRKAAINRSRSRTPIFVQF